MATGTEHMTTPPAVVIERDGLDALIRALMVDGYRVVGPTVRDGAIVLAELDSPSQLPAGWGVDVAPGHYRLRPREDDAVFAHSAGPQSWKQFLHPSRQRLWCLLVVVEVVIDVAEAVQSVGLTSSVTEFTIQVQGLLAIDGGLRVVPEQSVTPANRIQSAGLPGVVAGGAVKV